MTLYYTPSEELGPIAKGDYVEIMDRDMKPLGDPLRIVHVGKCHVRTDCGRRWTIEYGEFISDFVGGRPVKWPFPSIRKATTP